MVGWKIDLDNVSGIVRLHARQPCVAARQLWEDQRTPNICFQYLSHLSYWRQLPIICKKSIWSFCWRWSSSSSPGWAAADVGPAGIITVSHYLRQETSLVSLSSLSCLTQSGGITTEENTASTSDLNCRNFQSWIYFIHTLPYESAMYNLFK